MDLQRNHYYYIKDFMCLGMAYATENVVEYIYIWIIWEYLDLYSMWQLHF